MKDEARKSILVERSYKATPEELWNLWTTKTGFESWWGPEGFCAKVHKIEGRQDGPLHYDMITATPEMQAEMEKMGHPGKTSCKGYFSEYAPHERLVLKQMIDFIPGVPEYESTIAVDFVTEAGGSVRMTVTLHPMHDAATSQMQADGFTSQLTKLDARYAQG